MTKPKKLLSHRLRGFSEPDNSIPALKHCLNSQIKYLEIDIRVSKDGLLIVYHDPYIRDSGEKLYLHEMIYSDIIERFSADGIPTLEYFIETYLEGNNSNSILCLDIKDFGYETELFALLARYDILEKIYFISWIPETLLRLAELGVSQKLFFSYYPLDKRPLSNILSKIITNISMYVPPYFHITGNRFLLTENSKYLRGYQRVVMTTQLPEDILIILQQTGGGVCIEKRLLSSKLLSKLKRLDLQVWVFGLKNDDEYFDLETNPQVDVIFSDNAPYIMSHES